VALHEVGFQRVEREQDHVDVAARLVFLQRGPLDREVLVVAEHVVVPLRAELLVSLEVVPLLGVVEARFEPVRRVDQGCDRLGVGVGIGSASATASATASSAAISSSRSSCSGNASTATDSTPPRRRRRQRRRRRRARLRSIRCLRASTRRPRSHRSRPRRRGHGPPRRRHGAPRSGLRGRRAGRRRPRRRPAREVGLVEPVFGVVEERVDIVEVRFGLGVVEALRDLVEVLVQDSSVASSGSVGAGGVGLPEASAGRRRRCSYTMNCARSSLRRFPFAGGADGDVTGLF